MNQTIKKQKSTHSLSSSDLSWGSISWMSGMNPNMTQESGRSMVEMLGVLAVIGVLSVAGVSGFSRAMDKNRANEILNEASKRAVVVAGQISMSGNSPSITEFTNNDLGFGTFATTVYGENGTTAWTSTDKKFTLSITGVSEAVCNQMKNAAGATIKGFSPENCANDVTVKLTFNNDLSIGDMELELGLKQNVPCGTGFCYEGQTCTDATQDEWGYYYCGSYGVDGPTKCCKSNDDALCPTGKLWNNYYSSCEECPESGFVVENDGHPICCQKGTGKFWGGSSWLYAGNSGDSESICCTIQGGFLDGDGYACCSTTADRYDLQGRLNLRCDADHCIWYGKKADKKFYQIHEGYFQDNDYGFADVSEYTEWYRCDCSEADAECQKIFEEGYEH